MNEKNRFIILLLILENIVCSLCVNIAVIVSPSAGNLAKCAKLHERTSENTDTYGTYKCMFHNHIQKTRKNGPASRHDERSRNVRTNQTVEYIDRFEAYAWYFFAFLFVSLLCALTVKKPHKWRTAIRRMKNHQKNKDFFMNFSSSLLIALLCCIKIFKTKFFQMIFQIRLPNRFHIKQNFFSLFSKLSAFFPIGLRPHR